MKHGPALVLVGLALLPLLSLVGGEGTFLADPLSELPVKLWGYEAFWSPSLLVGGSIDAIAWPTPGPLNNPDIVATLVTGLLRPLLGRAWSYDVLVIGQLLATLFATWALARELCGDKVAALTAAAAFGLTPLVLSYCVAGAITDVLNLWPWPLVILFTLRALSLGSWKSGAAAGLMLGLGFATCPYNFVIFTAMAIPAAAWAPMAWPDRFAPRELTQALPRLRRQALAVVVLLGVAGASVGAYAARLDAIMSDSDSMVQSEAVGSTRHEAPYPRLVPGQSDRYTAYLADYVAVGKGALVVRENAARFYRAFSPGFLVMALGVVGLVATRNRWGASGMWLVVALFCVLASVGPFLPVTAGIALSEPRNPIWLGLHRFWPGGSLILEPFRYALPATLALALLASLGAAAVVRRFGARAGYALPVLVVLEVVVVSPTPMPLPTASMDVPEVYSRLDEVLPVGAIIELPYFDHGTARFVRRHFLNQRTHGRPIADAVLGFPPSYLARNQFTAALLEKEKDDYPLAVHMTHPERIKSDRALLVEDGFVGIVVTPANYGEPRDFEWAQAVLQPLGKPVLEADGVLVYALR